MSEIARFNPDPLSIPARLTLAEFEALPVTAEQLDRRNAIYRLEEEMRRLGDECSVLDELVPVHSFADGIYKRELTMPAGFCIVGKRHAKRHLVHVLKGKALVVTEHGDGIVEGPCTFVSPAGEKRALQIIEETTWVVEHETQATDPDSAEADLIINEDHRWQALGLMPEQLEA